MMKFTISTSNSTSNTNTNISTNGLVRGFGVFEKEEKEEVKKEIIKEFSQKDYKPTEENINRIIPCKNKLTKPINQVNFTTNNQLKYGLNLLNSNTTEDTRDTHTTGDTTDNTVDSPDIVDNGEEDKNLYKELFNTNVMKNENIKPILLNKKTDATVDDKVDDLGKMLKVDKSQYDKVPVENFGMAMLMGMGYNPNNTQENDNTMKKYTKRIYERGGLGTDLIMQNNMKILQDNKHMSKLQQHNTKHTPEKS